MNGIRTCNVRRCRKITLRAQRSKSQLAHTEHTLDTYLWIILGAAANLRNIVLYLYFPISLLYIDFSISPLSLLPLCPSRSLHHNMCQRSVVLSRAAHSRSTALCFDCICFYTISNWKCYDFSICCYCPCRRRYLRLHQFVCALFCPFICSSARALISSAFYFSLVVAFPSHSGVHAANARRLCGILSDRFNRMHCVQDSKQIL